MRLAVPIVALALAAASLAGCGSSSDTTGGSSAVTAPRAPVGASAKTCETRAADAEGLRATGVSCGRARQVMHG
jgi:type IV pilus biogenesis protein CpaD/CtpE